MLQDLKLFSATYLEKVGEATRSIDFHAVGSVAEMLWSAYENRRTVYVIGNGGSAATASHFATDLGKGTLGFDGRLPVRGFKVVSLSDSVAATTAWANDTGFDNVFGGPLARLIEPRDVVVAISASGNSPNVLAGVREAAHGGALTIALTGFGGGQLATICDLAIVVDSYNYGIVEDVHLCLTHILTQHLRERLLDHVSCAQSKAVPLPLGKDA